MSNSPFRGFFMDFHAHPSIHGLLFFVCRMAEEEEEDLCYVCGEEVEWQQHKNPSSSSVVVVAGSNGNHHEQMMMMGFRCCWGTSYYYYSFGCHGLWSVWTNDERQSHRETHFHNCRWTLATKAQHNTRAVIHPVTAALVCSPETVIPFEIEEEEEDTESANKHGSNHLHHMRHPHYQDECAAKGSPPTLPLNGSTNESSSTLDSWLHKRILAMYFGLLMCELSN